MNLGKPEIAGPVILVVGLCSFIGSIIYKFVNGLEWDGIVIPLVIGIILTIYGAIYMTGKPSDCVLSGSGTCSTSCGQGLYSGYTIKENAAYGGKNCDLTQKVPCYNSITCGSPAVELGPYSMAPWTSWKFAGNSNAKWVWINASGATGSSDMSYYSFLNASRSTLPTDVTVTLDVIVDDTLDDIFWNGSSLKSSAKSNIVHIPNLSFTNINNNTNNGYNTLDIRMHNTGGPAGLIYSVIDSKTNVPYLISSSSTTFKNA